MRRKIQELLLTLAGLAIGITWLLGCQENDDGLVTVTDDVTIQDPNDLNMANGGSCACLKGGDGPESGDFPYCYNIGGLWYLNGIEETGADLFVKTLEDESGNCYIQFYGWGKYLPVFQKTESLPFYWHDEMYDRTVMIYVLGSNLIEKVYDTQDTDGGYQEFKYFR